MNKSEPYVSVSSVWSLWGRLKDEGGKPVGVFWGSIKQLKGFGLLTIINQNGSVQHISAQILKQFDVCVLR